VGNPVVGRLEEVEGALLEVVEVETGAVPFFARVAGVGLEEDAGEGGEEFGGAQVAGTERLGEQVEVGGEECADFRKQLAKAGQVVGIPVPLFAEPGGAVRGSGRGGQSGGQTGQELQAGLHGGIVEKTSDIRPDRGQDLFGGIGFGICLRGEGRQGAECGENVRGQEIFAGGGETLAEQFQPGGVDLLGRELQIAQAPAAGVSLFEDQGGEDSVQVAAVPLLEETAQALFVGVAVGTAGQVVEGFAGGVATRDGRLHFFEDGETGVDRRLHRKFAQQGGTEGVNGGDAGGGEVFVDGDQTAPFLRVGVADEGGAQPFGDPLAHFGGRFLGEGNGQHVAHADFGVGAQQLDIALDQGGGLARAGTGGDGDIALAVERFLLGRGEGIFADHDSLPSRSRVRIRRWSRRQVWR
jgi:hypothetical protein